MTDQTKRFFMNKIMILTLALACSSHAMADGEFAQSGGPLASANIEAAEGETLSKAVGHYARSRSLLIEAIREFDRGARTARPDSILDTEEWRSSLVSRAEDLERVLSPQPRITKGGVKFEANTSLLNVTNK
jgi:hypothetical protein